MITEKSNRLQVIVITNYDYPISDRFHTIFYHNMDLKIGIR